ncbi:hypothetical protein LJR030_005526 [Rhizobium sp. LjRoot30]|uniref:hypothetical protein n=1 Tax=Rhizobium sp. LjRoot30 TaxID=3342320 RepID=UPI003ECFE084
MTFMRLIYKPDDDGAGELFVTAGAGDFAGKSSAWIGEKQLRQFEAALGAFPIEAGHEPMLEGGYWREGVLDRVHVRIRIAPGGPRGLVRVGVELATPPVSGQEPTGQSSVSLEFLVNYGDLSRFQSALRDHRSGSQAEAVLIQSPE